MPVCTICTEPKPQGDFYKKNAKQYKSECKECFRSRMEQRHDSTKRLLVEEAGGACVRCRYTEPRVLTFHHIDPSTKLFGIAERLSANIDVLRAEVAKCMLLCPNCHAEKHHGMW